MKTISVVEMGSHWPELEKTLATEGEIIIASEDGPVARMLPILLASATPLEDQREGFDWQAHMLWLKETTANEPPGLRASDEILFEMRNQGHHVPERP